MHVDRAHRSHRRGRARRAPSLAGRCAACRLTRPPLETPLGKRTPYATPRVRFPSGVGLAARPVALPGAEHPPTNEICMLDRIFTYRHQVSAAWAKPSGKRKIPRRGRGRRMGLRSVPRPARSAAAEGRRRGSGGVGGAERSGRRSSGCQPRHGLGAEEPQARTGEACPQAPRAPGEALRPARVGRSRRGRRGCRWKPGRAGRPGGVRRLRTAGG